MIFITYLLHFEVFDLVQDHIERTAENEECCSHNAHCCYDGDLFLAESGVADSHLLPLRTGHPTDLTSQTNRICRLSKKKLGFFAQSEILYFT